jgi:hypothetical protein
MRLYIALAGLAFFVTFIQYSFLAELLGKYTPDIAIVFIYVLLFTNRGLKDRDIELVCFSGFFTGIFSSLFSGAGLGALSLFYIISVLIVIFLVQRTSHILALFFIGVFVSRLVYLCFHTYFAFNQVAILPSISNAFLTSLLFLVFNAIARNYRIRIIHDKR